MKSVSLFELTLEVAAEDLEIRLREKCPVPWADFLLNPRRLRGSDFLMRWSQGEWSEKRLVEAVDRTGEYFALPYGPSGTAPEGDVQAFELYFERLEKAGLGNLKRPDLLIFTAGDRVFVERGVERVGGVSELPFTPENSHEISDILSRAILAVECETSLRRASQMPDYGAPLKPQRRLGGQLGLRKSAVLPTVILKEEDRALLRRWQSETGLPIHLWHVFFDTTFGLAFDDAQDLIESGKTEPTCQVFQAPGGATTSKTIYKFYYHYAYPLGRATEEPNLVADYITDKNGHILPYVRFQGGSLTLSPEALSVLARANTSRRK